MQNAARAATALHYTRLTLVNAPNSTRSRAVVGKQVFADVRNALSATNRDIVPLVA